MTVQQLTENLLQIILDRSLALGVELQRINQRQYPPTGPSRLIKLALDANHLVFQDIKELIDTGNYPSTIDRRFELFLRGKTALMGLLHSLMVCVEGADILSSPNAFVSPIRSMLKQHFGNSLSFDFIVKASKAYNYSIWTIQQELNKVITEAGYSDLLVDFPDLFLIIESPISETRNVPIHCIFAHEVGHVLYKTRNLASRLIPHVQSPRDSMGEKLIKAAWVEELTADAIALCILGPAYLFSFIYFAGPFCSMSDFSETHPPDNLRIKFLCKMLLGKRKQEGLVYKNTLIKNNNYDYVKQWQTYASRSIASSTMSKNYRKIFVSVNAALTIIMKETKLLTQGRRYSPTKYSRDIYELSENIAHGIPPNEVISGNVEDQPKIVAAESILNAGWSYLISGDDRFAKLLGSPEKSRVREKLFNLISAGLEYVEMQNRWSED